MIIHEARYVASFPRVDLCPDADKPEYAFIGRSNVGKSSLINMLTERKELAKVSGKPGKTQMINYFDVDGRWHLVDLPGYGYAVTSQKTRARWQQMIENYLRRRAQLQSAFVLIDANIAPQRKDLDFINWMGAAAVPFAVVFTKADRSKPAEVAANVAAFQAAMLADWEALPPMFQSSARLREGREAILDYIETVNRSYYGEDS